MRNYKRYLISTMVVIFISLSLLGCSDDRQYSAAPVQHNSSYYVGNSLYGHWALAPSGQEIWVMHPRYSHFGPSTMDAALALGLGHLYYRSIWRTSYPGGWGSTGSYNRTQHTTINKTIINNYGDAKAQRKAAKSPAFAKKRAAYKKSGKGKIKQTKKMQTAFNKNKSKGLNKPTKTIPKKVKQTKKMTTEQYRATQKKKYNYKPSVKKKYIYKKSYSKPYKSKRFGGFKRR